MRRTLILASLIATAALGGCGDSDEEPAQTSTVSVEVPSETTTAAPESEAPVPPDDSAGNPEAADDPGADRPRSIEDVVTAVLTGSEKPAVICDQLVTENYVKTAYGDRAGCLAAQQPGALADSVASLDVNASSESSATAVAVPSGGPYDGVEVEVELVPATDLEDAWLIDSLLADVPAGP